MYLFECPLCDGGWDTRQAVAVPLDSVALVCSGTCQSLGCLQEIFSLVVGHVAALCSGVALLNGCSSAVKLICAGYPLLQSCAVASLTKDMCNTTVDVTFSVPVDPEWATIVLYQLPFAEVCQCVLCVSWHGDTLSHSQYTMKIGWGLTRRAVYMTPIYRVTGGCHVMSSMGTFICARKTRNTPVGPTSVLFYAGNSFQRPFTALFDAPVNESPR